MCVDKKKFNRLPRFKIDPEKQCVCCLKTPWKTVLTCSPDGSLKTDLREINMEHTRWRMLNRPPQNHTIHHSECEYWKLPYNIISYIIVDSNWSWMCREHHLSVMETKGFNFLLKVALCWTFHVCKWTENRAATHHSTSGGVDWSLRTGGVVTNLREVFAPSVTSQKQNKQKLWIAFSVHLSDRSETHTVVRGNGEVDFTQ